MVEVKIVVFSLDERIVDIGAGDLNPADSFGIGCDRIGEIDGHKWKIDVAPIWVSGRDRIIGGGLSGNFVDGGIILNIGNLLV